MSPWLVALLLAVIVALLQYGWNRRAGLVAWLAALMRVAAITLVVALLLDAPAARAKGVAPWAALDASLSMARGGPELWRAALDSLRRAGAESVFVFGDSLRRADTVTAPHDASSMLRPAVDRALGAGHPLTVITDGEIDDPDAARALPGGSRVIVLHHAAQSDAALASLDAPRAVVAGDSIEVRIAVAAGGGGARASTVALFVGDKPLATATVDSLAPFAERTIDVKTKVEGVAGPAVLRAIVKSPGDAEPRNDTVSVAIDVSRAASAVFASTSPDFDARYALAVLRGSLGIPTRGYFRVAPGEWRIDGALTPVTEADVRQALHDAPVAIIHGDTSAFGEPRTLTLGPLALVVTSGMEGEWYPSAAPASPLAPALSGVAWDSLPPVAVASTTPKGTWEGVDARRGRGAESKPLLVGTDEPRRVVVVAASGMWRWRFRGGSSADAFAAFWGSIFDWLAAERADRRAAVPDERLLRAGDPIRWRRGAPVDSVVSVVLRSRGSSRVDSLTLRFPPDVSVVESHPLAPGVYDVTTRGGSALLVINASREWLPRAPRLSATTIRGSAAADAAPRLRADGWAYALAIGLLCLEWLVRRRRGMR